jgi:hypothetical protein
MAVSIRPCHSENDDETCPPRDWPTIDFLEHFLDQEIREEEPEPVAAKTEHDTNPRGTTTTAAPTTDATTTTTATNKKNKLILNGASLQASARWALMKKFLVSAAPDKDDEEAWAQRILRFSHLDQCPVGPNNDDDTGSTTTTASFVFDPPKRHERQWTQPEIQTVQKAWNHWVVERNPSCSSNNHTPKTNDLYELWPTEEEESNSATSSNDHHHQRRSVLYSNQRPLQWNIMDCPPACKFQLHAHPNVELILCLQGELHEVRMMGPPLQREAMIPISTPTTGATATPAAVPSKNLEDENHAASRTTPELQVSSSHYKWNQKSSSSTTTSGSKNDNDQTNDSSSSPLQQQSQSAAPQERPPWKFSTLSKGTWLVNEVGSVHQSFTATSGTGCKLLVLWGGSHANVPRGEEPFIVQQALEQMDQLITNKYSSSCACDGSSNGGWERLEETFLPASERQRLSNDS